MMKIPMNEAISTGAWFECEVEENYGGERFRFRVLSFEKIDPREIDEPGKIELDLTQGWLYLMKYEIVNLSKTNWFSICFCASHYIIVIDQDDCMFSSADDEHITCDSSFADSSGLSNELESLAPKMRKSSAMLFHLPKEEGATYFLGASQDLREI